MRICLDCRYVGDRPSGIASYTLGLLSDLLKADEGSEFILLAPNPVPAVLRQKVISGRAEVVPLTVPPTSATNLLRVGDLVNSLAVDVYHLPHHGLPFGLRVPSVITIHHFVDPRINTGPPLFKRLLLLGSLVNSIFRANRIIAVSKYTASLILKWCRNPDKVVPIYPPPSPVMRVSGEISCESLPSGIPPGRYFLTVAESRPHKNIPTLVDAFARASDTLPGGWKLVIVGPQYRGTEEPSQSGVIWLGDVGPALLAKLYRCANAVVLVSLIEHFGYPAAEAMYFGVPLLLSKVGSLPEIAGPSAMYVDPYDKGQIARAMSRLAVDQSFRKQVVIASRDQLWSLGMHKAAARTIKLYQEIIA